MIAEPFLSSSKQQGTIARRKLSKKKRKTRNL